MAPKRILLYGGCHAVVMRNLLVTHFFDDVTATLIINYELIRSGRPFPYDGLRDFDIVLYSPIENKGEYNTSHLAEACRAIGVDTICYPWLEWHGYCPGATKGDFKSRLQWRYRDLAEAASSFASFQEFMDWAIDAYPTNSVIDATLTLSTAMVRESEKRYAMAVTVSDFILEHYARSRLFLISDHPSLMVYLHVLHQILALMGINGETRCAALAQTGEEPQWRWRTPIFPRVAKRLGLRFSDTQWVDDEVVPERCLDLRSYLLLYYHSSSVILGPIGNVSVIRVPPDGAEASIEDTTRLVADPIRGASGATPEEYQLLEVLSGNDMPFLRHQRFAVDKRQWRSAWN